MKKDESLTADRQQYILDNLLTGYITELLGFLKQLCVMRGKDVHRAPHIMLLPKEMRMRVFSPGESAQIVRLPAVFYRLQVQVRRLHHA